MYRMIKNIPFTNFNVYFIFRSGSGSRSGSASPT